MKNHLKTPTNVGIDIVNIIISDIIQRVYVPLLRRWAFAIHNSPEDGDKNSLDNEYIMPEYVSLGWSISF